MSAHDSAATTRPMDVCRALLDALDATEGRRRRRKRNTRPDAIGIGMKRKLLEQALRDDPDPDAFEGWLLERCFEHGAGEGAWRAMALEIFHEWRMADAAPSFRAWLQAGAPSDDKPGRPGHHSGADRGDGSVPAGGAAAGGASGSLPVLLLALALPVALAACDEGGAGEVPTLDVVEMEEEERQEAGITREVLEHLLAGAEPGRIVYDPAVDLARPADADRWPPPSGAHGDEARGAWLPDDTADAPAPAPDTAGGGSGASNVPEDTATAD